MMALILFILFASVGNAQSYVTILDENKEPLPAVHLTFKTLDGKKKQTVMTDINGKAFIPTYFIESKDAYIMHSSFIGYDDKIDTLKGGVNVTFQLKVDEVSLEQVVITGQYKPNSPEKSIHKIKIIDRKQLDSRGVVNLNDALQFETNMRISQDNMLGAGASVQGISGENVKIMIDGVPIIGRQDGNIDLNQINLNNIERIEIVEGPLSVNYGTNALAGTINLITKKDQIERYTLSGNTYYESVGQYNLDAKVGYKVGNHLVSIGGGRNYFDGWSEGEPFSFAPLERTADTTRNLQWNPKEQLFADGQWVYSKDKRTYRLFGNYFGEDILSRGTPRAPYNLTAFDEVFLTKRYMIGTDFAGPLSKTGNWSVLASYSDYKRTRYKYFKDLTTLEQELTNNPNDHDTTKIQTWMSRGAVRFIPVDSKINWEFGYDVNHETAYGKRVEEEKQSMGDYALFATAEWSPFKSLLIKPGLRYAYNTSYNAPVIPSINFKYNRGRTSLRFSFARGFRAPSIKELYFEFVDINHNIYGNPDLKAERSSNFQLDLSYKIVKNKSITSLDGGLFFNDIKDMISLAQLDNGANYSYINIGEYRTQGLELSVSESYKAWKASAGMVYTGRLNTTSDSVTTSEMLYSPEFRFTVNYEFKKLGGNLSAFYKFNGEVPTFSVDETGGMSQRLSEQYSMIDIAATKYLWKKKVFWSLGVKNLLDVTNVSTVGTAGGIHNNTTSSVPISWGRTFFTSIKFNLSWK